MDFAADLSLFYTDFAVEVTHTPRGGGASMVGRAFHNRPGMTLIGGDILATDHALRYAASTFPVVRKGDSFVIDGQSYTARENAQPVLDGLEYTVSMAKV